MSIVVHTSHSYFDLVDAFSRELLKSLRDQPIHESTVIVPNHRIANWLSTQVANRLGICINLKFVYLNAFIKENIPNHLNHENPYLAPSQLPWSLQCYKALSQTQSEDENEASELKLLQYAWEYAGLLEIYTQYRPEWLEDWKVQGSHILAKCWQSITDHSLESASPFIGALEMLHSGARPQATKPHGSVTFLFGFWAINDFQWHVLERLTQEGQCHAFFNVPSTTFLADLSRSNLKQPIFTEIDQGPQNARYRLLSKLSSRGRAFQSFLLDQDTHVIEHEQVLGLSDSLLSSFRRLLIEPDTNEPITKISDPQSLQIHSCSNQRRELESIKACIQTAILQIPELKLEEIQVYAPNINEYAALIPLVFESDESDDQLIRYNVRQALDPKQIDAFQSLFSILTINQSGWSRSRIMEILRMKGVKHLFGLSELDLDQISEWIDRACIHYGNKEDQKLLDENRDPRYSWNAGIRRLLLEYTNESIAGMDDHARSASLTGDQNDCFEKFLLAMDALAEVSEKTTSNQLPLHRWIVITEQTTKRFIASDIHPIETNAIHRILREFGSIDYTILDTELDARSYVYLLRKLLPSLPDSTTLARKTGVTFSSIQFEDLLPSRTTLIMGLSDGAFPRNFVKRSFDKMQDEDGRMGDPSPREDDLYWLLQSIVGTSDQWIATYIGQDEHSTESLPMASALQKIHDTLNGDFIDVYGLHSSGFKFEIIQQPRFSYDRSCFQWGSNTTQLFSTANYQAATHLSKENQPITFIGSAFAEIEQDPEAHETVDGLIQFYRNPSKYFCEKQLGIRLSQSKDWTAQHEPMLWATEKYVDKKICFFIQQEILKNKPVDQLHNRILQMNWISDNPGENQIFIDRYEKILAFVENHSDSLEDLILADQLQQTTLQLGNHEFQALQLKESHERIVLWLNDEAKAKHFLEVWIFALSIWTTSNDSDQPEVVLLDENKIHTFTPIEDAKDQLQILLQLKMNADTVPLPLYLKTSFLAAEKGHTVEQLEEKPEWNSQRFFGEKHDPYILLTTRNRKALDDTFITIAKQVFVPLISAKNTRK